MQSNLFSGLGFLLPVFRLCCIAFASALPCVSREPFSIFHSTDQKYCSSDRIVLWDTSVPNNPVRAALLQAFSRVDMSVFHWQSPWRIMGSHKLQLHAQRSIPNHPDKRDAQAQCFSLSGAPPRRKTGFPDIHNLYPKTNAGCPALNCTQEIQNR